MRQKNNFLLPLLLAILLCVASCASSEVNSNAPASSANNSQGNTLLSLDDDDEYLDASGPEEIIYDPIEPWNRFWFTFNDITIEYVLSPINKGYVFVTPEFMRTGIGNFFTNLAFPVRFFNNLFQGKGMEAGVELSSFVLNTTAGLGGFIDVASSHEKYVTPDVEDGGQTLGVWGMGEGIYIVWPFLGPSNVRDTLGMGMDYFMSPTTYIFWNDPELGMVVRGVELLNSLDEIIDAYDTMKGMAVEPYSAIRDGYTQMRRAKIAK